MSACSQWGEIYYSHFQVHLELLRAADPFVLPCSGGGPEKEKALALPGVLWCPSDSCAHSLCVVSWT